MALFARFSIKDEVILIPMSKWKDIIVQLEIVNDE